MSANFTFIPVTSMLSVRTLLEAMNASAGVVTVAMDGYVMVFCTIILSDVYCEISRVVKAHIA